MRGKLLFGLAAICFFTPAIVAKRALDPSAYKTAVVDSQEDVKTGMDCGAALLGGTHCNDNTYRIYRVVIEQRIYVIRPDVWDPVGLVLPGETIQYRLDKNHGIVPEGCLGLLWTTFQDKKSKKHVLNEAKYFIVRIEKLPDKTAAK